jgi:hypothetical protein
MNLKSAIAATLAVLFLLTGVATAGRTYESHVYVHNTTDAYVWVTAYGMAENFLQPNSPGKSKGAWCIPPGKYDQHGLKTELYEIRVEVSAAGCQREPVLFNEMRGFPRDYVKGDHISRTMTYYVAGTKGKYTLTH